MSAMAERYIRWQSIATQLKHGSIQDRSAASYLRETEFSATLRPSPQPRARDGHLSRQTQHTVLAAGFDACHLFVERCVAHRTKPRRQNIQTPSWITSCPRLWLRTCPSSRPRQRNTTSRGVKAYGTTHIHFYSDKKKSAAEPFRRRVLEERHINVRPLYPLTDGITTASVGWSSRGYWY